MNGTETQEPCGGEAGEIGHGIGIGAPGLLHHEWHARANEKAEDFRHVAVTAERNDEFRFRHFDHLAIVSERNAAKAVGAVLSNPLRAVRDPYDVAPQIPQDAEIGGVVGRVPVADVNRGNALRHAHQDSSSHRATYSASPKTPPA